MDEAVVKSTAKGKGKIANAKGAHKAGPPGGYKVCLFTSSFCALMRSDDSTICVLSKSKEFLDSEDNPRYVSSRHTGQACALY